MANNEDNLIPQSERTKEEQREIARKGGIASGEARRRRKSLAEVLRAELDKPVAEGSEMTKQEYIVASMVLNMKDNFRPKDIKVLCEILGELKQKVEVDNKGGVVLLPESVIDSIQKNKQ